MKVLVTGAAGFIGFHTTRALLNRGYEVFGFDNLNAYYSPAFKLDRLRILQQNSGFRFEQGDLANRANLESAWNTCKPDIVIHLAAQAGVRFSIESPMEYVESNLVGFQNILELARQRQPRNFVYASSSSVYGGIKQLPFHEGMNTNCPISFYAVTKMENELAAKTYSRLFDLPTTGLRFFTVYGPHGRPDMAIFKFAELAMKGEEIPVFNHGKMIRDFTFIDDIVDGVLLALNKPERGQIYNLGKGHPDSVMDLISNLEVSLNRKVVLNMMPIQPGDVEQTLADITKAKDRLGYNPKTQLKDGVSKFSSWFLEQHNLKKSLN